MGPTEQVSGSFFSNVERFNEGRRIKRFKNHSLPGHVSCQCGDGALGSYGVSKACGGVPERPLASTVICQTVFAVRIFLEPALRAP